MGRGEIRDRKTTLKKGEKHWKTKEDRETFGASPFKQKKLNVGWEDELLGRTNIFECGNLKRLAQFAQTKTDDLKQKRKTPFANFC